MTAPVPDTPQVWLAVAARKESTVERKRAIFSSFFSADIL